MCGTHLGFRVTVFCITQLWAHASESQSFISLNSGLKGFLGPESAEIMKKKNRTHAFTPPSASPVVHCTEFREPDQWLQRHREAGSSWPSRPKSSQVWDTASAILARYMLRHKWICRSEWWFEDLGPENRGHNPALTVVYVLYALDSGSQEDGWQKQRRNLIRTSIYDEYSRPMKIPTHLDHISNCEKISGTNWSNR